MLKIILLLIFQFCCIQSYASLPRHSANYLKLDKLQLSIDLYFKDCPHLVTKFNSWDQILQSQSTCWNGPYLKQKDIKDSFNNTILIERISPSNTTLISIGIDKIISTKDDMRSSDNK